MQIVYTILGAVLLFTATSYATLLRNKDSILDCSQKRFIVAHVTVILMTLVGALSFYTMSFVKSMEFNPLNVIWVIVTIVSLPLSIVVGIKAGNYEDRETR